MPPRARSACRASRSPPASQTFPACRIARSWSPTIDGVRLVNDSKATNADATAKALACYDDIYWIVGGQAKEGGLAPLAAVLRRIAPRLPDRRGGRAVRRPARRQGAATAAAATSSRRSMAAHGAMRASAAARRGGAAVAGLRLVRPVRDSRHRGDAFRAAGARAAGRTSAEGGMIQVPRARPQRLGHWWWTVDRWTLAALVLADRAFGALLVLAASPAVAERIGARLLLSSPSPVRRCCRSALHRDARRLAAVAAQVRRLALLVLLRQRWR